MRVVLAELACLMFVALALGGCSSDGNGIVCEGQVVDGRCVFSGPDSATFSDQTSTPDTNSVTDKGNTVADPGASQDTTNPPEDAAEVESCPVPGDKPTGAACAYHCECRTGYCYDEAYLGDFRFCTRDCEGLANPCGSEDRVDGQDVQQYQCLNFGGTLADTYGLKHTNICHVRCQSVADCANLSSKYDYCPSGFSEWDGKTVGAPSCQIKAEVD